MCNALNSFHSALFALVSHRLLFFTTSRIHASPCTSVNVPTMRLFSFAVLTTLAMLASVSASPVEALDARALRRTSTHHRRPTARPIRKPSGTRLAIIQPTGISQFQGGGQAAAGVRGGQQPDSGASIANVLASIAAAIPLQSPSNAPFVLPGSTTPNTTPQPFDGDSNSAAVIAAAFRGTRCRTDAACANARVRLILPANGAAVCNQVTYRCQIGCMENYLLTGGSCERAAASCGNTVCPSLAHGIYVCSGAGVCTAQCDSSNGWVLASSGTVCFNPNTDRFNCGAEGLVCRESYSTGSPYCKAGKCTLACGVGRSVYKTQGDALLYCA